MKKKAQRKPIVILGIFTLVTVLLIGEITARVFIKPNTLPAIPEKGIVDPYSEHPYLTVMRPYTHFLIPGSKYIQSRSSYKVDYNINSMGFRGGEILPKEKNTKRMIVIGDSIVEGQGCDFDKTFSRLLDKKARAHDWEVLNLGVHGASPMYFTANMDRYLATEPDAAVIMMFENDMSDDRYQERNYFIKPIMDDPGIMANGSKPFSFLARWSRLCVLFYRSFKEIYRNPLEKIVAQNSAVEINSPEQKELAKKSPILLSPSMMEKQWPMSRRYLDLLKSEFTQRKIPVYMVFFSLGALHPGRDKDFSDHVEMMNSRIKSWAEATGTPFLSLVPVMKKLYMTPARHEFMMVDDGHPTPKMHGIIAEILWKWIAEGKQP